MKKYCLIYFLFFFLLLIAGCKKSSHSVPFLSFSDKIPKDTLRIVTQYGATSYFDYNGETMGYDYEMVNHFSSYLHLPVKITVARNDSEMYSMLREGKADVAAYNTLETKELKQEFNFVFPQQESYLVVVQHISTRSVSDPVGLIGKEVWVKPNTIHHRRLQALNDELGGGIIIKLAADSLTTDDLMQQVSDGKITFTIAYRHKALLQKSYDSSLDCRVPVGFTQQNGWLVRKNALALTDSVNSWLKKDATNLLMDRLYTKYWDKNPYFNHKRLHTTKGGISPYDHFFKKYAPRIGWDWRLLAAVAYAESEFDNNAVSYAGARGIMQLMPSTAREFGLDNQTFSNPESNIAAGVEYIKSLNMIYRKIEDKDERIKFILASYNSGPAHIIDAMALAEKYGKSRYIWFDHVEYYLSKKNKPEFYQDPVCKYGKFGPKETLRYVPFVLDTYARYLRKTKK